MRSWYLCNERCMVVGQRDSVASSTPRVLPRAWLRRRKGIAGRTRNHDQQQHQQQQPTPQQHCG
jgi:hypothetical protein